MALSDVFNYRRYQHFRTFGASALPTSKWMLNYGSSVDRKIEWYKYGGFSASQSPIIPSQSSNITSSFLIALRKPHIMAAPPEPSFNESSANIADEKVDFPSDL